MKSGELQFDWEQFSEIIALISLGAKEEESISLVNRLVDEASASYPQLSQLRFVHIPLPVSRLEIWSYWLAAQVVGQWRDLPVEEQSVATIIDELGLMCAESGRSLLEALDKTATDTPLSLQLIKRVQSLRERQHQHKLAPRRWQQWLEEEAAELAEWFTEPPPVTSEPSQSLTEASGCLVQLQSNALALRSRGQRQLSSCFVRRQQAGSRALRQWLGCLSEALDGICAGYEVQRQDRLRRESSAWRAYYKLSASLQQRNWWLFCQCRLDWEATLRALAKTYHFKLEGEMYTQAVQLIGELAQQTHLYAASVARMDTMLASLEGWFIERGSVEPLFLPLLKEFLAERVNPAQLRSELESRLGCSLNQWVALNSTQTAALLEHILAQIQPFCVEVYAECCRYLLNLNPPDCQTHLAKTAKSLASAELPVMPPSPEKRLSLQVCNGDIRDALALVGRVSGEKVVADESISCTVSLALNDVSVTEALNALMVAGSLSYIKSGDVYIFSHLPSADSPATAIPELNNANPAAWEIGLKTEK